jgi:hypothetical protein
MVWGSLRDPTLPAEVRGDLRRETTARIAVGSLFVASAALYSVGVHRLQDLQHAPAPSSSAYSKRKKGIDTKVP